MKILIAGSSGMVGSALIESLSQKGYEITRLLRNMPKNGPKNGFKNGPKSQHEFLTWNPPEEIPTLTKAYDAVINLCGEPVAAKRWSSKQKKRLYESRVDTTKLLAGALVGMDVAPKVFLNASAIGIYGDAGDKRLTEPDALKSVGANFMAELCTDWEAAVLPAAEVGIDVFTLRIGLIVGRPARFLKLQKPLFNLGLGGWLGNPKNWLSWVSLVDTVGAINFILESSVLEDSHSLTTKREAKGESVKAVNLTAPNPVTAKQFAKALGKSLKRPVAFRIPKLGPQILLGKELVDSLLQSARVEPKVLIDAGYEFQHPDIESAFRDTFQK